MPFASYLLLEQAPSPSLDGLVEYAESAAASRWFCGRCGAHVFLQFKGLHGDGERGERFLVTRGLVDDMNVETQSIKQLCLAHTVDGGLLRSSIPSSTPIPESGLLGGQVESENNSCFTGSIYTRCTDEGPDYLPNNPPPLFNQEELAQTSSDTSLLASCHCTGVQFSITPPDHTSRTTSSPWSDLLVPFHSAPSENPDDVKWWLRENDTKYLAGLCGCNSCRLASGFPIQSWAFIPRSNIFTKGAADDATGGVQVVKPLDYDDLGSLKRYQSSPGVYREFCGGCGATVFWHCDWRPGVVDVSVGLLRAESGVRADKWLDWVLERVSFEEEAVDKGLIACLKARFI
ncbi:hypothetical protein FQN50_004592 [Emmonsiellopsis sp. PD_5]|nr:hypothetical protein FQN50_004592 [Emmonsiellopsis sp. PD_5]